MLIPLAFVVFMLSLVIFESVRASYYQKSVRNYKNSVAVIGIKDIADKLNLVTQNNSPSIYCVVESEGLLREINKAYQQTTDDSKPSVLIERLSQQIEQAGSPPAFNSVAQFVPSVRRARQASLELYSAVGELTVLTGDDERSDYCTALVKVLSEVYFLPEIDSPEGVSALFVGQLENFQVNVAQAKQELRKIAPPSVFVEQHIKLGQLLNTVELDLRNDANKYSEFSRRIEGDVEELQLILRQLKDKSTDLQKRPSKIAIYADVLD